MKDSGAYMILSLHLFLLFSAVPVGASFPSSAATKIVRPQATYTNVNVSTAKTMIDSNPSLAVLDVRLQAGYYSGHIRDAKLIPLPDLEGRLDELDKTDEILVYDESGGWSATASQTLIDNGFMYVYNMLGGAVAWIAEGYQVFTKYPSIQEAMNALSEGETLYVSWGTYHEHLVLNKSMSLIGENVQTTVIDGNNNGTVVLITADDSVVQGFTIRSGDTGIYLNHSDNSMILENRVVNNDDGIFTRYSHNCTIHQNVVRNNTQRGILTTNSSGIIISKNHAIENFHKGIGLANCSNCTVVENCVESNEAFGVSIETSENNTICHNSFISNGIQASAGSLTNRWHGGYPCGGNYWSDYSDRYPEALELEVSGIWDTPYFIYNNNEDEYPLVYPFCRPISNLNTGSFYTTIQEAVNALETLDNHSIFVHAGTYSEHVVVNKSVSILGQSKDQTVVDGGGEGTAFSTTAANVAINGLTIKSATVGFYLMNSNNSEISNNIITNVTSAVTLDGSSRNNLLKGNSIQESYDGIALIGLSSGNTVKNNVFALCTNHGVTVLTSGNLVSGNTFLNGAVGIYANGSNNTYCANNITRVTDGIVLVGLSNESTVEGNMISQNENYGLAVLTSNNLVTGNTMFNNTVGIYANGSDNTFYHNNIIDNKFQVLGGSYAVWDNGYEGNFWSDYNGADLNGDGLGDTYLPWKGLDYYPLMHIYWNPADVNHDLKVDIYDVVLISGAYMSTPANPKWNGSCDLAEPYGIINIYDVVVICGHYGETFNH